MKAIKVKKKGKRRELEYQGDNAEQVIDVADIKQLDHQYKYYDQFTKHSIRK